jgi:hypothetical protein
MEAMKSIAVKWSRRFNKKGQGRHGVYYVLVMPTVSYIVLSEALQAFYIKGEKKSKWLIDTPFAYGPKHFNTAKEAMAAVEKKLKIK